MFNPVGVAARAVAHRIDNMNETKPVPTKIGAVLKGACAALIVLPILMYLDGMGPSTNSFAEFATAMGVTFLPGGFAGLFVRWNLKKHFTPAHKPPTKIGAFLKGGGVGFVIFWAWLFVAASYLRAEEAYDNAVRAIKSAVPANEFYYVCDGGPSLAVYILLFAFMGGCAGMFLWWNYEKYFATIHTPKTDNEPRGA